MRARELKHDESVLRRAQPTDGTAGVARRLADLQAGWDGRLVGQDALNVVISVTRRR